MTTQAENHLILIDAARIAALRPSATLSKTTGLSHAKTSVSPNAAGNRLALQGQSELTGLLGVGSEAKGQTECTRERKRLLPQP